MCQNYSFTINFGKIPNNVSRLFLKKIGCACKYNTTAPIHGLRRTDQSEKFQVAGSSRRSSSISSKFCFSHVVCFYRPAGNHRRRLPAAVGTGRYSRRRAPRRILTNFFLYKTRTRECLRFLDRAMERLIAVTGDGTEKPTA